MLLYFVSLMLLSKVFYTTVCLTLSHYSANCWLYLLILSIFICFNFIPLPFDYTHTLLSDTDNKYFFCSCPFLLRCSITYNILDITECIMVKRTQSLEHFIYGGEANRLLCNPVPECSGICWAIGEYQKTTGFHCLPAVVSAIINLITKTKIHLLTQVDIKLVHFIDDVQPQCIPVH